VYFHDSHAKESFEQEEGFGKHALKCVTRIFHKITSSCMNLCEEVAVTEEISPSHNLFFKLL
jgi:hypothetical protein